MATTVLLVAVKLEIRAPYPYLHAIFWVCFNGYDISLILIHCVFKPKHMQFSSIYWQKIEAEKF